MDTVAVTTVHETKPFYKTSEFWLTVATNLLGAGAQIAGSLPPKYAVPTMAVVNLGYVLSRGIAKSGTAPEVVAVAVPPPVMLPPFPDTGR